MHSAVCSNSSNSNFQHHVRWDNPDGAFQREKGAFFNSLSKLVLVISKHNHNLIMSSFVPSLCDCRDYDAVTILFLHLTDNLKFLRAIAHVVHCIRQRTKNAFLLGRFNWCSLWNRVCQTLIISIGLIEMYQSVWIKKVHWIYQDGLE